MSLPGVRHVEPLARRTAPVPPQATTAGELGDRCRSHARPNSRQTSIARTRQVTVTKIICGVDVSSISLDAFVGPSGPARSFRNTAEGIAELAAFCGQQSDTFSGVAER